MKKLLYFLIAGTLIFSACKDDDDDDGMQPQPETQTFKVTIENITQPKEFFDAGVFNTPVGKSSPGPIMPGEKFEFTFNAGIGNKLSFATMFAQSNDLFFAPVEGGIALYDNGTAVSGDVTSMIRLWDAGTEMNEEPGVGANQAPRQSAPNTGPAENANVREIGMVGDGYTYPAVSDVIKVSIEHMAGTQFKVTIENVSDMNTLMTSMGNVAVPLSPGVWVLHMADAPLFKAGEKDRGQGIERIAEDGNPDMLGNWAMMNAGYVSPFAPGVWAVHSSTTMPLFTTGENDRGQGLEALAEDADPSGINTALEGMAGVKSHGVFNTPVGGSMGPITPGNKFEFTMTAEKGDHLSFGSMLGQSNDLFFAPADNGIALWDANGPISGDVSSMISIWDAGTEMNEYPGAGPNQAPRQDGPNTGTAESKPVQKISSVNDGFMYPMVTDIFKVTVTPQ